MKEGTESLLAAVAKAANRNLDLGEPEDHLNIQRGCYILNSRGHGPVYDYSLYIKGPYSPELAEDLRLIKAIPEETDIPHEAVNALRNILSRGTAYAEAYATVLLLKRNNADVSPERILNRALELRPDLDSDAQEAYASMSH